MKRYKNEAGEIGVIISSGYGAGWSSWNSDEEFLSMDSCLVEMCLRKAGEDEVKKYCVKNKIDAFMGGWAGCSVEFIDEGTAFRIDEYDGSETLITTNDFNLVG